MTGGEELDTRCWMSGAKRDLVGGLVEELTKGSVERAWKAEDTSHVGVR
jgi:hypothetical protein